MSSLQLLRPTVHACLQAFVPTVPLSRALFVWLTWFWVNVCGGVTEWTSKEKQAGFEFQLCCFRAEGLILSLLTNLWASASSLIQKKRNNTCYVWHILLFLFNYLTCLYLPLSCPFPGSRIFLWGWEAEKAGRHQRRWKQMHNEAKARRGEKQRGLFVGHPASSDWLRPAALILAETPASLKAKW